MEDLIKQIQDKTGLPADKVLEVVTIVTEFLKENLPEDLIDQITSYISQAAAAAGDTAGTAGSGVASTAQNAVSAAAGVASTVFSKAMKAVSDLMPSSDDANTSESSPPADDEPADE